VFLDPQNLRYNCYSYFSSSDILLGNSTALSEDVIRRQLITQVPNDNSKISFRYSILVKQYAISDEAYKYWQIVKQNSEQTGNLFDPQPAQLYGNIQNNADAAEPVIGYISASTLSEKRIFIRQAQLKVKKEPIFRSICDEIVIDPDDAAQYLSDGTYLPAYFISGGFLVIAPPPCVDCRLQGGTTTKPDYW